MENFSDIITANEDNRKRVLAEIIKSGVQIPCIDGVIISEEAEIEANAVILPNTQIYGKAKICANAEVGPGSIVEDCIIGENAKVIASHCYRSEIKSGAEIGPFVRIRPDCTIGENARVGNFVELKNAEVRKGAKISHLSYIGDSEVGEDVNIGCGCATVNFDGRNKNRTVICDGAFIGCGVGAFMILIDNPVKALWFVIIFLVLQQIEGNIIYPKVMGKRIGLPSLWVLVAITLGSGALGAIGMLIFVPIFAVVYQLLNEVIEKRKAARLVKAEAKQKEVTPG